MKAIIILGCEGRQDSSFKFCSGVENIVVDLEVIVTSDDYMTLVEYMDKVVNIFNSQCYNSNIISNALYKMYELNFFDDTKYKYISHFYRMHERCGLTLKCLPKGYKNNKS